jgi:hypothetical protein
MITAVAVMGSGLSDSREYTSFYIKYKNKANGDAWAVASSSSTGTSVSEFA